MPKSHTDSHTIEHHDDGTWTETVVHHGRPATKAEKAQAWGALGGLTVLAFAPLIAIPVVDWWERRRDRKFRETLEAQDD